VTGAKPVRFIYRHVGKKFDRLFGAFDLETYGLGGAYADGFTWEGPGTEPQRHYTADSMFKALLTPDHGLTDKGEPSTRQFIWLAHNGGKYDFAYLARDLREYALQTGLPIETIQQGTKVIGITIKTPEGKVQLRDTLPLLQTSLERASKAFAPDFAKSGHCPRHDFTVDDNAQYDPTCRECVDYAEQDVISLWHTYVNCRSIIIGLYNVEPAITTGATAIKAWQATIPKGMVYYRQHPQKEAFLRNFTTGAYITPGCTSAMLTPPSGQQFAAVTVDRTAAFGASMLMGNYPTDAGTWVDRYDPEAAFAFYEVTAERDRADFPAVPLHSGGVKAWATGSGTAYVTSEQFEQLTAWGYKLTVVRGLVHDRVEDVFGPFMRKCEDMEYPGMRECPVHGPQMLSNRLISKNTFGEGTECSCRPADPTVKAIAKNMRNSLNGKLNIKEEQERLYIGTPPDGDEDAHIVVDERTGEELPVYTKTEQTEAPYCNPGWYAITVSRQQLEELRLVALCEPDERFKCDTDSVTMPQARYEQLHEAGEINTGGGYGNYKVEHWWLWHQSTGPKNYRGDEQVADKSKYTANCKGINRAKLLTDPRFMDAHARAAEGERVQLSWDSVRSFREMVEHDLVTPGIVRTRTPGIPDTVHGWVHDRATRKFSPMHFAKNPDDDAH